MLTRAFHASPFVGDLEWLLDRLPSRTLQARVILGHYLKSDTDANEKPPHNKASHSQLTTFQQVLRVLQLLLFLLQFSDFLDQGT